jgi:hypothetical protein
MVINFSLVIALATVRPTRTLVGNQPLIGCALLGAFLVVGLLLARGFHSRDLDRK